MILIEMCRILVNAQNYLDEIRQNTNSWDGIQIQVLHPRAAPGVQGWGWLCSSPRDVCPCIPQRCPLCANTLGVLWAPWRAE